MKFAPALTCRICGRPGEIRHRTRPRAPRILPGWIRDRIFYSSFCSFCLVYSETNRARAWWNRFTGYEEKKRAQRYASVPSSLVENTFDIRPAFSSPLEKEIVRSKLESTEEPQGVSFKVMAKNLRVLFEWRKDH